MCVAAEYVPPIPAVRRMHDQVAACREALLDSPDCVTRRILEVPRLHRDAPVQIVVLGR